MARRHLDEHFFLDSLSTFSIDHPAYRIISDVRFHITSAFPSRGYGVSKEHIISTILSTHPTTTFHPATPTTRYLRFRTIRNPLSVENYAAHAFFSIPIGAARHCYLPRLLSAFYFPSSCLYAFFSTG